MAIITLTTDFGTRDGFVGALKGVILGIAPQVQLLDLSHDIPRHDIRSAAFALKTAAPHFPKGSIHLVVIDPGVGSARNPMILETLDQCFVLPDNGLISFVLEENQPFRAFRIENPDFQLAHLSRTFHGRDLFAPAAAHLARGIDPSRFGPAIEAPIRFERRSASLRQGVLVGEVLHIDTYGNIISNIATLPDGPFSLGLHGHWIQGPVDSYDQVPVGQALAIVGSHGWLEIAINQGRADQRFHAEIGSEIVLAPSEP